MKEKKCLVGRDDDSGLGGCIGILIGIAIVVLVVICLVIVMCSIGALIGAFHAIKNYFISLKQNLVDSNLPQNN